VRQVVYRKEVVVRAGADRERKAEVLAPKSVAKFDVSAWPIARVCGKA